VKSWLTRLERPKRLESEAGSLLPLTIFYGFLSLVLILLVVAATSLYLERKRLFTLADGAALVGAEAFALDEVSVTAGAPRPTLRSEEVRSAVAEYLEAVPHDRRARPTVAARPCSSRPTGAHRWCPCCCPRASASM
jgi:hypothetical protein